MSAEPAKAKDESAAVPITITFSQANGYGFNPSSNFVPNQGTVQFIAPQACWIWTSVGGAFVNVFANEQLNHEACAVGGNNNFTLLSQYNNTAITVQGTNVNAQQPPPQITESLKGTIHVGSSAHVKEPK